MSSAGVYGGGIKLSITLQHKLLIFECVVKLNRQGILFTVFIAQTPIIAQVFKYKAAYI